MKLRLFLFIALTLVLGLAVSAWRSSSPEPAPQTMAPVMPSPMMPMPATAAKLSGPMDPDLATLIDPKAAIANRVLPDMTTRFPRVSHPEDFPLLVRVLQDSQDNDTARNEVINLLRRSSYPDLYLELIKVINNKSESSRFRAFATQHLGDMGNIPDSPRAEATSRTLHLCVEDRDVEVRREALLALAHRHGPDAAKIACEWLSAQNAVGTRDLAIRCVHELGLRGEIPNIRKYLCDPDEVTRIAAIVVLSQWLDDDSRNEFEQASVAKSPRLSAAGKAALKRLDAIDRAVPKSQQTLEMLVAALQDPKPSTRHAAAKSIRRFRDKIAPALPALMGALEKLDGTTRTDDIGIYLDSLRGAGSVAAPATDSLLTMLEERSPIYKGRNMEEVHHVRGYIILTLADIGTADRAITNVTEYLANSDQQLFYTYACAARAAKSLKIQPALVPLLQRGLTDEISIRPVSLASFSSEVKSLPESTNARMEAIRALGAAGSTALKALPLLTKLANAPEEKYQYFKYNAEARKAIAAIQASR